MMNSFVRFPIAPQMLRDEKQDICSLKDIRWLNTTRFRDCVSTPSCEVIVAPPFQGGILYSRRYPPERGRYIDQFPALTQTLQPSRSNLCMSLSLDQEEQEENRDGSDYQPGDCY